MEKILRISGNFSELKHALDFGIKYLYNGDKKALICEMDVKFCFQITSDGIYCIGWYFDELPVGWHDYQFDFDTEIVSQIIKQVLDKKQTAPPKMIFNDGSIVKGFLMENKNGDLYDKVINWQHLILSFETYYHYYGK